MVTAGTRDGLKLKEALLIRRGNKKLVAARVIKLFEEKAAVYVVARYSRENPSRTSGYRNYDILYGIPLDVPDLPANIGAEVADELERNPQDETFFVEEGREYEPEIDDETYTPEVTVHPEFPRPNYRKTHNISLGIGFFQNTNLLASLAPEVLNSNATSSYQGYYIRYGYNFKTYFWLKRKIPALITIEGSLGFYNFDFQDLGLDPPKNTQIDVIPMAVYLRYNYEFNPLFMVWGYVGFQNNVVSATNNYPEARIKDLEGSGIAFGLGAGLVMSQTIDLRVDAGNDGAFFGGVVKF